MVTQLTASLAAPSRSMSLLQASSVTDSLASINFYTPLTSTFFPSIFPDSHDGPLICGDANGVLKGEVPDIYSITASTSAPEREAQMFTWVDNDVDVDGTDQGAGYFTDIMNLPLAAPPCTHDSIITCTCLEGPSMDEKLGADEAEAFSNFFTGL